MQMSEFTSWRSYWDFRCAIGQRNRYFHDTEVQQFLDAVLATHHTRVEPIPAGRVLWRAQLGYEFWYLDEGGDQTEVPVPFNPKRMKPNPSFAREGRVNPKGIAYLYLTTERDTALAEVRPWIGSTSSVGQFRVKRDLTIVDCTTDKKGTRIFLEEPTAELRETAVWTDIDRAFAEPVDLRDDVADYAPTQVLAELFKVNGCDGVEYRSSLGEGHNIALFDLDMADLVPSSRKLSEVKAIHFDFHDVGNPCSS
jgi:hypothetical protein